MHVWGHILRNGHHDLDAEKPALFDLETNLERMHERAGKEDDMRGMIAASSVLAVVIAQHVPERDCLFALERVHDFAVIGVIKLPLATE